MQLDCLLGTRVANLDTSLVLNKLKHKIESVEVSVNFVHIFFVAIRVIIEVLVELRGVRDTIKSAPRNNELTSSELYSYHGLFHVDLDVTKLKLVVVLRSLYSWCV